MTWFENTRRLWTSPRMASVEKKSPEKTERQRWPFLSCPWQNQLHSVLTSPVVHGELCAPVSLWRTERIQHLCESLWGRKDAPSVLHYNAPDKTINRLPPSRLYSWSNTAVTDTVKHECSIILLGVSNWSKLHRTLTVRNISCWKEAFLLKLMIS